MSRRLIDGDRPPASSGWRPALAHRFQSRCLWSVVVGATTVLQARRRQPAATPAGGTLRAMSRSAATFKLGAAVQLSISSASRGLRLGRSRVKAVVAGESTECRCCSTYGGLPWHWNARALVVSGSRDWVRLPSGLRRSRPRLLRAGCAPWCHRLVIAEGGDHFQTSGSRYGEEAAARSGGLLLACGRGLCRLVPAAAPGTGPPPSLLFPAQKKKNRLGE